MLSTRLRYALFKIENGWTRQSLSEVENLYYRRQMSTPKRGGMSGDGSLKRAHSPPSPTLDRAADPGGENSTYADFWSRLGTAKEAPEGGEASGDTPMRPPQIPEDHGVRGREAGAQVPAPAQPTDAPAPHTRADPGPAAPQVPQVPSYLHDDTKPMLPPPHEDASHAAKRLRLAP